MNEVTFRVPKKYVSEEDFETHDVFSLPWVNGWSLKRYYASMKHTRHLQALNLRMTVRRVPTREPVRTSYIPKPGDTFVFVRAGQSLS